MTWSGNTGTSALKLNPSTSSWSLNGFELELSLDCSRLHSTRESPTRSRKGDFCVTKTSVTGRSGDFSGSRNGFVLLSWVSGTETRFEGGDKQPSGSLPIVVGVENCLLAVGRGIAEVLVLTIVGDGLELRPAQL